MMPTPTNLPSTLPKTQPVHVQPGTTLNQILKKHVLEDMGRLLINSNNPTELRAAATNAINNRVITKVERNLFTRNFYVTVRTESGSNRLILKPQDTTLRS